MSGMVWWDKQEWTKGAKWLERRQGGALGHAGELACERHARTLERAEPCARAPFSNNLHAQVLFCRLLEGPGLTS